MNFINNCPFKLGILAGVRILIVDNDCDSRDLYTFLLEDLSGNVISSSSIQEAVEILTWFVPHILVCEIRFLGESVYALLNKLTAMEADNRNHIPIIVTSTSTTGTIEQIPDVEFEGYLLKPIDLDKLVFMIENLVNIGRNNSLVEEIKHPFIEYLAANSSLSGIKILALNKIHE
ncbi:response regulator [Nostoc sp. CCY0012]|uniref:response regulator n=1 Tax=Nostoc sp. CCY0012 TaxID=1056123 RepID=UPI0039C5B8C7